MQMRLRKETEEINKTLLCRSLRKKRKKGKERKGVSFTALQCPSLALWIWRGAVGESQIMDGGEGPRRAAALNWPGFLPLAVKECVELLSGRGKVKAARGQPAHVKGICQSASQHGLPLPGGTQATKKAQLRKAEGCVNHSPAGKKRCLV